MKENKNLRTSTIRVSKETLEEIKIYCREGGHSVGEWVDFTWEFLKRNDFDIFDMDLTPSLPVPPEVENERNTIVDLCKMIGDFVTAQKQAQLQLPSINDYTQNITQAVTAKVSAEGKVKEQEKDIKRLEDEIKRLEEKVSSLTIYKENAYRELCRIRDEQKVFGKIDVKTNF